MHCLAAITCIRWPECVNMSQWNKCGFMGVYEDMWMLDSSGHVIPVHKVQKYFLCLLLKLVVLDFPPQHFVLFWASKEMVRHPGHHSDLSELLWQHQWLELLESDQTHFYQSIHWASELALDAFDSQCHLAIRELTVNWFLLSLNMLGFDKKLPSQLKSGFYKEAFVVNLFHRKFRNSPLPFRELFYSVVERETQLF